MAYAGGVPSTRIGRKAGRAARDVRAQEWELKREGIEPSTPKPGDPDPYLSEPRRSARDKRREKRGGVRLAETRAGSEKRMRRDKRRRNKRVREELDAKLLQGLRDAHSTTGEWVSAEVVWRTSGCPTLASGRPAPNIVAAGQALARLAGKGRCEVFHGPMEYYRPLD